MEPRDGVEIEARLPALMEIFYERVRRDPQLGPVFEAAIDDWPRHLQLLADFWSSVALTTGRYKGHPMQAHLKHQAAITPEMFDRWLALWHEATDEMLSPTAAALLQEKAARIARSLNLALTFRLTAATDGPSDKKPLAA
ncbi:group III truncated hemoglobin [Caulobacter sp. 17J80-11]|uniref:group III truncated hemoglobin n=1 Tax=Caulobacter sp. 17J80-11 TaxID=2763502 RepID=UPI001653B59D|nr:group III truncated hemoglobin [Caulobacter sp. 17J80-11]MBC6983162.1 group III truncated hemoglobin [Caulobacter sp. 17J80-11]